MVKRGAARNNASVAKKTKMNEVNMKVQKVIGALEREDYFVNGPESNRSCLINSAPLALQELVENRHPIHEDVMYALEDTLNGIESHLEGNITAAERTLEASRCLKVENEMEFEEMKIDLVYKKEVVAEAMQTIEDDETNILEAEVALDDARKAADFAAAETDRLEKEKNILEEDKLLLEQCESSTERPDKQLIAAAAEALERQNLEGSIVSSTHSVMKVPIEDRKEFDLMILQHIQEQFTDLVRTSEMEIRNADIVLKTAMETVEEEVNNLEALKEIVEESKTFAETCEEAVVSAEKALKQMKKTMKEDLVIEDENVASLETAKEELEVFQDIKETFYNLKERTEVQEPVVEVQEEAVEEVVEEEEVTKGLKTKLFGALSGVLGGLRREKSSTAEEVSHQEDVLLAVPEDPEEVPEEEAKPVEEIQPMEVEAELPKEVTMEPIERMASEGSTDEDVPLGMWTTQDSMDSIEEEAVELPPAKKARTPRKSAVAPRSASKAKTPRGSKTPRKSVV